MTDIVKRLRERSQYLWTTKQQLSDNELAKEAADEIERLKVALLKIVLLSKDPEFDYPPIETAQAIAGMALDKKLEKQND